MLESPSKEQVLIQELLHKLDAERLKNARLESELSQYKEPAKMKKDLEEQISWYLAKLPHFEKQVKIDFYWIEENYRRDADNAAFSKKFILDAMVKMGILKNDNRKYVGAFSDYFPKPTGENAKVILKISEMDDQGGGVHE